MFLNYDWKVFFLFFFLPLVLADKELKMQFCKIQKYYSSEEGLT